MEMNGPLTQIWLGAKSPNMSFKGLSFKGAPIHCRAQAWALAVRIVIHGGGSLGLSLLPIPD